MELNELVTMLARGTGESLYMTIGSTVFAYIIGLPLGVLLVLTNKNGLKPLVPVSKTVDAIVNIIRSIPFLILMIAISPFTVLIVGKSYGPTATIMSLVIAASPFIARLVESSLLEVDHGVIEAAQSMGASPMQIILKVLIPEAKTSLISGATIALATILGYSAMAGAIGGGGLGDIAIRYGYYRYETKIMIITVVLLVLLVQIMQMIGTRIARATDKRIKE